MTVIVLRSRFKKSPTSPHPKSLFYKHQQIYIFLRRTNYPKLVFIKYISFSGISFLSMWNRFSYDKLTSYYGVFSSFGVFSYHGVLFYNGVFSNHGVFSYYGVLSYNGVLSYKIVKHSWLLIQKLSQTLHKHFSFSSQHPVSFLNIDHWIWKVPEFQEKIPSISTLLIYYSNKCPIAHFKHHLRSF